MPSPDELRREAMRNEVLKDIESHPGTWVEDIARRLGWNRATVSNYVRELTNQKKVKTQRKGPLVEIRPANGK